MRHHTLLLTLSRDRRSHFRGGILSELHRLHLHGGDPFEMQQVYNNFSFLSGPRELARILFTPPQ